ncbi:MAG: putative minor capsid protein [Candidatus Limiplasma sp.]|nr:putative minor capsid protein [Candidatus Limiplasma sp.]
MRPIPLRLLIHTVLLNNVERDDYGKETDKLVATLQRVRMEPSSQVIVNSNGTDVQCSATLFVDSRLSWPVGQEIKAEQSVLWEGRRFRVQAVNPLFDDARLHHLEVLLSDG